MNPRIFTNARRGGLHGGKCGCGETNHVGDGFQCKIADETNLLTVVVGNLVTAIL